MRELVHLRERGMEIGEEVACGTAIVGYRAGLQGEGERLDLRFEDLFETGLALTHERCEALRETVGLVSKDKCGDAEDKRDFAALVDALRLQKLRELPVRTENVLVDPDLNEKR